VCETSDREGPIFLLQKIFINRNPLFIFSNLANGVALSKYIHISEGRIACIDRDGSAKVVSKLLVNVFSLHQAWVKWHGGCLLGDGG